MTIATYLDQYKQLLTAILGAGPDVTDDLADVRVMCDSAARIYARTVKRFGHSAGMAAASATLTDHDWQQIRADSDVQSLEQKVVAKCRPSHGDAQGVAATPVLDTLRQIIQFIMANPALLQFILSLLKTP